MLIRSLTQDDCNAVYTLSNHPEVRRYSFSHKSIPLTDHNLWFKHKLTQLQKGEIHFLTAWEGETLLAMARSELKGIFSLISIAVNPQFQGKGYATTLLTSLMNLSQKTLFLAIVCENNTASSKLFTRLGFQIRKYHHHKFFFVKRYP